MANVTTNILRGALQRVKTELDSQASTFNTALANKASATSVTELSTALAAKANSADIAPMSAADGNALFDEIFSAYQWSEGSDSNGNEND